MISLNVNPGAREVRSFARLWFPLFAAALGGTVWWHTGSPAPAYWAWGIGALLAGAMQASPRMARSVFIALILVTYPVGIAISYTVLAAMFFLVFTPIGFVMRLAGRDPLALRGRSRRSHWQPYEQDDRPDRAFRQF
jgi:Saxitoxin biosynthesis operon protein SxtJ